jgi:hypothetical protein
MRGEMKNGQETVFRDEGKTNYTMESLILAQDER